MPSFTSFYPNARNPFSPPARQRRAILAILVILGALAGLGAAFFRTQVVRNSEFVLRAEDNRFRMVAIAAPRGTIFDRNGEVIAETVTGYTLSLEPGSADSLSTRLHGVAALVGLDTLLLPRIIELAEAEPDEPVVVLENLSFAQLSRVQESPVRLPGMVLEARPVRRYPYGTAVAHLVGYVAEISAPELENPSWEGYRMGQNIGKSGVEREYERTVGGSPGDRYVEVNARGELIGRFAEQLTRPPRGGADLRLTIDLHLQRYAEAIFPREMKGAVVAMVPSTGEILAMHSSPSYDPNLLVGRIPPKVWRALNTDPDRPLLNRATQGIYPPGSTWKLATAIIGLNQGVITPETKMPFACTGGMSYAGRYSRCWKKEGHGYQDLSGAIANSCNVYFYQLGIRLGINLLTREGTRLGFARKTGVDLPSETSGTFPSGREWYQKRFGWRPPPAEVMNLAIGQGPNSQTPLRMAQFFSALAGDGTAAAPHLLLGTNPPIETDLGVSPATLEAVREGMARVVEGGTAAAARLGRWKLYGKTGTSQNNADLKRPHAWFTGFAGPRGSAPEIVVAVIVEFGESGSGAAAPIASKVAGFYLDRRHGYPTEPLDRVQPSVPPLRAPLRRTARVTTSARGDAARPPLSEDEIGVPVRGIAASSPDAGDSPHPPIVGVQRLRKVSVVYAKQGAQVAEAEPQVGAAIEDLLTSDPRP